MGRAPCCDKSKVKKGPWSPEEDTTLKNYLNKNGTGGNWIALPTKAGLNRCGKSCRLRWLNYLRPDIKRGSFTEGEDNLICTLYGSIGSRWSVIASQLPGRTDNDVKNYWNTKLKKKLLAGKTFINNNTSSATRDTTDINNLEMFSAFVPKIETPHDPEFYGTLPYVMDVSLSQSFDHPKQEFESYSQFPHSNPVELVNDDSGFGVSSAQEVSGLIPASSVSGPENNYNMWSANEGANNDSGVLMDFGFERPADVLLDGFGF